MNATWSKNCETVGKVMKEAICNTSPTVTLNEMV